MSANFERPIHELGLVEDVQTPRLGARDDEQKRLGLVGAGAIDDDFQHLVETRLLPRNDGVARDAGDHLPRDGARYDRPPGAIGIHHPSSLS